MNRPTSYLSLLFLLLLGGSALFSACKKDDPATPAVVIDKAQLSAVIDSINTVYNNATEGTKPGTYAAGSKATLKTALDAGTATKNDATATQASVNTATASLRRAALAFQNSLIQEVSVANLVAQWKFNGNANDATPNGNNGTLKTGPGPDSNATTNTPVDGGTLPVLTTDRFGVANMAYAFDKGGYIEVPYKAALNPQAITLSAWVYRTNNNANNYIISLNRWHTYKFQLQDFGKPFLTVTTTAGGSDRDDDSGIVPVNTWTHVATSYVDGTMKFYINGKLIKTYTDVKGALAATPTSIPLVIGQELAPAFYNQPDPGTDKGYYTFYGASYFQGSLDDIRVYNKALSDAEVTSIYSIESTQ